MCTKQPITPYDDSDKEPYLDPSFKTIDEELFPEQLGRIFLGDRGSACCTEMVDPVLNKTVNVAVVHPKTRFPGKNLPEGVFPNTYLSRWIAFSPEHPYRIVARSGMFCLGYPSDIDGLVKNITNDNVASGSYQYPLATTEMNPLSFGGVPHNCPRIHFVMGLIDKIVDDENDHGNTTHSDSVLISYGVSDCLSRIVEVSKADIHAMLWPNVRDGKHYRMGG
ncbi:MAG: hypothetical protein SGILL_007288 [Bacillariaceae sp.]